MATMDAAELRAALEALGLNQTGDEGLTEFLNVAGSTVRRWCSDHEATEIPESVAMLLRMMVGMRLKPRNVLVRYGRRRDADSRAAHADSRVAGRR